MPAAEPHPAACFMFDDRIAWGSTGFVGADTARPACTLLIGAYHPLTLGVARQTLRPRAVLVGPNVTRSVAAEGAGFYSLTLDPAHKGSRHLRNEVLRGRRLLDLSAALGAGELAAVREAIEAVQDCAASFALSERLLQHFFPGIEACAALDPRALRAAAWLRAELPTRVDLNRLAAVCHLSPGRLTHLFSDELGVSIRSYLRWIKLCKAVELFGRKQSVAEVAATIGFADSAHLIRVFRAYYSVKPSFLADRTRVRVHSCGESAGGG